MAFLWFRLERWRRRCTFRRTSVTEFLASTHRRRRTDRLEARQPHCGRIMAMPRPWLVGACASPTRLYAFSKITALSHLTEIA